MIEGHVKVHGGFFFLCGFNQYIFEWGISHGDWQLFDILWGLLSEIQQKTILFTLFACGHNQGV